MLKVYPCILMCVDQFYAITNLLFINNWIQTSPWTLATCQKLQTNMFLYLFYNVYANVDHLKKYL